MRAKNRSPIKGLYLVGGSAHPGGGLPLVGISGDLVTEAIGYEKNARH
jgi:phytoene dehydrogenase-like protein